MPTSKKSTKSKAPAAQTKKRKRLSDKQLTARITRDQTELSKRKAKAAATIKSLTIPSPKK